MSLNGLDTPAVHEAYQAAVSEAGGWFLLKYISRDAVELLSQGRNGVSEARNAIMAYTEMSPLYGLIMYRRRKILIKHIPDGTSRLLQARTAVHFSDILEKYSPYETLLEISTGDALNDTALAASFQLHTASRPSPSPIPSSRLDEIREDGEDSGPVAEVAASTGTTNTSRNRTERRAEHLLKRKAERPDPLSSSLQHNESSSSSSAQVPSQTERAPPVTFPPKASVSQFLVRDNSGRTSVTAIESPVVRESGVESRTSGASTGSAETPPLATHDVPDSASQTTAGASESTDAMEMPSSPERLGSISSHTMHIPGHETAESALQPRISTSEMTAGTSETSRRLPLDEDPYDLRKYDEFFKPKVRLGPRPVATFDKTKRPAVARVSALPASFKIAAKKLQDPPRPLSSARESNKTSTPVLTPVSVPYPPLPPPIPDDVEYKPRPVSRGSIKSTPSHKSLGMTSDKLRLMKALELRKRQLKKAEERQNAESSNDKDATEALPDSATPPSNVASAANKTHELESNQGINKEGQSQAHKADSGIELGYEEADNRGALSSDAGSLQQVVESEQLGPVPPLPPDTIEPVPFPPKNEQPNNGTEEPSVHPDTSSTSSAISSSSESLAPTERPLTSHQIDEETIRVPTIVMADETRPVTAVGEHEDDTSTLPKTVMDEDESSGSDTQEEPVSPRLQNNDMARRRRGFVEPLQTTTSPGNPDDSLSDDDDLLEELHSATVQEAKPIMVSRSPNAPVPSARRPSAETAGSVRSVNITRSTTMPVEKPVLMNRPIPEITNLARSPTAPTSPTLDVFDSMSAVSRNVSSGISRRIQALAEMSSRPLTPEIAPKEERERERRPPSKTRPASFRKQSGNRGVPPAASQTGNESATVWNVQRDPVTNRNSVSVTARIVRPSIINEDASEEPELQRSELKFNHQRESQPGDKPASINTSRAQSVASSPALSPVSHDSGETRQMHSASRFGRHKQPSPPGVDTSLLAHNTRNMSSTSLASNNDTITSRESSRKEGSKTSRLLKRMSNMNFSGGARRRTNAQSTISETSMATVASHDSASTVLHQRTLNRLSTATEKADMPPAVLVGDLNVQFPDSLLWKRRIVTVDESGNLQFAIAQAMEIHKGVALRKFALTDLRQPYTPDSDVEELAHSLLLELHDGTSLQLACEDAMTQRQVLQLLKTYWRAWTATA